MTMKLIISLQVFSLLIFSSKIDSASFRPLDAKLIEDTCKQTPFYDLCVSTLKSDPGSSGADTSGLALIMVHKIEAKATETLNAINRLIKEKPDLSQDLNSCAGKYDAIIKADVPQAVEALTKGDPKFAQDSANDAAVEADTCEGAFKGGSPLTDFNTLMNHLSRVTSAIVQLLL